jgi:hypothetical protein
MTLLARIADLKRRAEAQQGRQTGLDEVNKLQPLLRDAKALAQGLGIEVTQLHLLRDQGLVPVPTNIAGADAGAALTTLDPLRTRFAQDRRTERLTQGTGWTRLKEKTEAARTQAASTLDQTWRGFVSSAYGGDKPADLERNLAPTDGNNQQLQRYRSAYNELLALSRRPGSREDFERVRELARLLREIHQGFDFSVPDAVKRFLDAMAAGGADLDLLTDEVRDWLHQQGGLGRYQIVARRSAP